MHESLSDKITGGSFLFSPLSSKNGVLKDKNK